MRAGDHAARVIQLKRTVRMAAVADPARQSFLVSDSENRGRIKASLPRPLRDQLYDRVCQEYCCSP